VKGSARAQSMDEHGYAYGKAYTPPYESKTFNAFPYNSPIKFPANPFSGPGVLYAKIRTDTRGDYNGGSAGMRSRLRTFRKISILQRITFNYLP